MRETLNSMSIEVLRLLSVERKSRWLTTFSSPTPTGSVRVRRHRPVDAAALQNAPRIPARRYVERIPDRGDELSGYADDDEAGRWKNAAALVHKRPKPVVTVKVDSVNIAASAARIQRKRYRQRLSSVAAADEADPGDRGGMTPAEVSIECRRRRSADGARAPGKLRPSPSGRPNGRTNPCLHYAPAARRQTDGEADEAASAPHESDRSNANGGGDGERPVSRAPPAPGLRRYLDGIEAVAVAIQQLHAAMRERADAPLAGVDDVPTRSPIS